MHLWHLLHLLRAVRDPGLVRAFELLHTQVILMSEQLDTLNTKVDTLGAKVTALEAGYDQVSDALKALQAAGGATPEDLSTVIAKIDAITAGVDADAARNAQSPVTPTP